MYSFKNTGFSQVLARFGGILALAIMVSLPGCDVGSSVINKNPQDQISETAVFSDPNLVDSYLFDAYNALDFWQAGGAFTSFMSYRWSHIGAEYVTVASWQYHYNMSLSVPDASGSFWAKNRWDYENVRRANTIIEKLRNSDQFDQEFVETRVAEARFIRAFAYYRMVKRYGGVPLITEAQGVDTPRDSVFVPRSDEKEVWDFIASELDAVAQDLPDGTRKARATRWAALGLKSRAMTYAASVAQFGEQKTAGSGSNSVQLGMPASQADQYWQQALDAAEQVINSGPYSLYNEYPSDPDRNYYNLFVTEATENPEVILAELFDGQEKGHGTTFQNLPMELAKSWGANGHATWHVVNLFNYQDGSDGYISESELTSQQWSPDSLFGNRDPRFKGAVLYPEVTFGGERITFHSSTMYNGEERTDGMINGSWPASAPARNIGPSSLLVKKRTRSDIRPASGGTEDTDYIEMRLGELYMNAVEAAFELDQNQKALDYINEIRNRAGMPEYSSLTREKIRNERQRELVLEEHRYWDLRRWRTAHEVLDGLRVKGARFQYDWDTGEYNAWLTNAEGRARTFRERQYYLPFGNERISDNPALVENPGY